MTNATAKKKLTSEIMTSLIRMFGLGLNYGRQHPRLLSADTDWFFEKKQEETDLILKAIEKYERISNKQKA